MSKRIDLTGQRFVRWTVICIAEKRNQRTHWLCRCDCGTQMEVESSNLRAGKTKSCGCLNEEARYTHGHSDTPTYRTWITMRVRCRTHHRYAGRGITFDPRWESFENFLADMGERPVDYTLERIDNDGPYSADNCRWATRVDQANNRYNTRFITYQGKTQPVAQWAREVGLPYKIVSWRIKHGWPADRALGLSD